MITMADNNKDERVKFLRREMGAARKRLKRAHDNLDKAREKQDHDKVKYWQGKIQDTQAYISSLQNRHSSQKKRTAVVPLLVADAVLEAIVITAAMQGLKQLAKVIGRSAAKKMARKIVIKGGKKTLTVGRKQVKAIINDVGQDVVMKAGVAAGIIAQKHMKALTSNNEEEAKKAADAALKEMKGGRGVTTPASKKKDKEDAKLIKTIQKNKAGPPKGYTKMKGKEGYRKKLPDGSYDYWYPNKKTKVGHVLAKYNITGAVRLSVLDHTKVKLPRRGPHVARAIDMYRDMHMESFDTEDIMEMLQENLDNNLSGFFETLLRVSKTRRINISYGHTVDLRALFSEVYMATEPIENIVSMYIETMVNYMRDAGWRECVDTFEEMEDPAFYEQLLQQLADAGQISWKKGDPIPQEVLDT